MKADQSEKEGTAETQKIFTIKGDWQVQSKQLQAKFPFLTEGDLKLEIGKENEMLKSIESRLHMNRDEVIAIIEKNELE